MQLRTLLLGGKWVKTHSENRLSLGTRRSQTMPMTRTRCKHLTLCQMLLAHEGTHVCYLIFIAQGWSSSDGTDKQCSDWLRGLRSRPMSHHYWVGRLPAILVPFLVQVIPSKDRIVCIQQEPAPDIPALLTAGLLTDLTFLSWDLILSFQVFPAPSDLSLEDTFVFFHPVLSDSPPRVAELPLAMSGSYSYRAVC